MELKDYKKAIQFSAKDCINQCGEWSDSDMDDGEIYHIKALNHCIEGNYDKAAYVVIKAAFFPDYAIDKRAIRAVAENMVVATEMNGGAYFLPICGLSITEEQYLVGRVREKATKIERTRERECVKTDNNKLLGLIFCLLACRLVEKNRSY